MTERRAARTARKAERAIRKAERRAAREAERRERAAIEWAVAKRAAPQCDWLKLGLAFAIGISLGGDDEE